MYRYDKKYLWYVSHFNKDELVHYIAWNIVDCSELGDYAIGDEWDMYVDELSENLKVYDKGELAEIAYYAFDENEDDEDTLHIQILCNRFYKEVLDQRWFFDRYIARAI